MKIDYTSIKEDTNFTIKSDFEKKFRSQYAIEAARYPFLSKSQIRNRTMTIMKKKNISLPRFKEYEFNPIKKISKLEPSASKRCKNLEDNQSLKETSAKFPSKKSLVPLKVDFVSNSSNGALKKNSSGSGEKRRVSFNKELYIRYRTTSEESSSSTLKDKKNQLKKSYNRFWTQKFVRSQRDDKFDKLINWSYRSPKITHKNISMKITKESLHAPNTYLDEVPQNKLEEVINNKLLKENKDDDLCTSDESYLENNALCNWQKDVQNERVDLSKTEKYIKTNNEISNEESVHKNVKYTVEEMLKKDQIEFASNSKKISDEKNIEETLNDSAVSGDSSSDEEILQSRFPVQDEECNSPESPASFPCTSDNESSLENDLEIKEPLVVQAETCESVDCKTNGLSSEMNEQLEKNDHQETATDRANYSVLSVDADNSNIETESSSYMQNSTINKNNTDLNFDETKDENEILLQEIAKTEKNEKTLDQNAQEKDDISPDIIIEQFFNGSFDISIFKPEKNSTMIANDRMVAKQKHLMKDEPPPSKKKKYKGNVHKNINNKEVHNVLDHSSEAKHKELNNNKPAADSMIQLKRKISEKQTENSKKTKMITRKNKNIVTDIISDKLTLKTKSMSENKYSKANSQQKKVNNRLQYNDKEITILNNFDMIEENSKKNKTKSNTRRKPHKNEEIFRDFSNNITPLKKSRNLRNSSLVASKKIKEIEKLENAYNGEEILIDSDSSCFDSNFKKIEDSFKSIFKDQKPPPKYEAENKQEEDKSHQDIMNITSLEGFQTCFEKQGKGKGKRTARNNRKYENKIENIFDIYHKTAKCQLKMDNRTLEENFISDPYQPDFLIEENRDTTEKYLNNKKRISNRRQSKSDKRTENKLLEYSKNIDKTTPSKKDTKSIMNYGITTRSKKKTWEMLQKELLGETNDVPFSDSVAKTVLSNKPSVGKHSMKDVDLYPSVIQTISMRDKRNKYDGKYKIQDTESKYLQTPANNMQSYEIVPYKSKSIVEKTIATMERCTAGFITPKENSPQKEWIHSGLEFDDMTDEISIGQEAEFHSNMTFVTKENEKYYKNEIVAIVKQSSSIINETPCRNATKTIYNGEEYKYGFREAEHLIKKSIITESYSVNDNSEENLKTINQALIPSSNKKQSDPWTRLIKKLNLEQCNNENKYKAISSEKPKRRSLSYHENLKQYTNADGEMQRTLDLNKRKFYKQGEIEKEKNKQVLKQITFEETPIESNHMAICNDLNVEDNCITNDTETEKNYKKAELGSVSVAGKITRKMEAKERQARQTKKVKTSPKFKLEVEDGGVKFRRCNRSFSSSSEESEKRKQKSTKQNKKIPKNREKLERQEYKRYLSNMFEKDKSKDNKIETISQKKNSQKYPVKEKNKEQGKMINTLIAEDDDDLFSISSSDSEPVNKGKGLLFDIFDE